MRRGLRGAGTIGAVALLGLSGLLGSTTVLGQEPAGARESPEVQMRARFQVAVMEGVLEKAVEQGARLLRQQMQPLMPSMFLLSGSAARARGFRIEGHGVFFDVEVPALQQSVAWSFRKLDQTDLGLGSALNELKRHVQSLQDDRDKRTLEQALKRVELQVGPAPAPDPPASGPSATHQVNTRVSQGADPAAPDPAPSILDDPGEAYTSAVKSAIIDAMLDYSGPMAIGLDEWLTVAAKDNEERSSVSMADLSEATTIMIRISGADLAALRAGRLTRDEARRRVEVREF